MANVGKYYYILHLLFIFVNSSKHVRKNANLPLVINTWAFVEAGEQAWDTLYNKHGSVIDAVEAGGTTCEQLRCDRTVGYGGSPDENGETTLDALIMDGSNLNVGAVAGLRRVKNVISVARRVLENTRHSLLAGDLATAFALQMGFKEETLQTLESYQMWKNWTINNCQPNFWKNVTPNPRINCGPYKPLPSRMSENDINNFNSFNHDTIGIIAIDVNGHISAGTSTNGAKHKIPGRVGDSPIPGAGAYADDDVGAAAATGDGDIMMRLLPSFLAVEEMRRGVPPTQAAIVAINRIVDKYPTFFGAVIAANKEGVYGAACHGMQTFPFVVCTKNLKLSILERVSCITRH